MAVVNLKDRVITRSIGQPMIGTVTGFVDAEVYADRMMPGWEFPEWDLHYPNWRAFMVVFVLLD